VQESSLKVDDLNPYQRGQVTGTIAFPTLEEAQNLVERLENGTAPTEAPDDAVEEPTPTPTPVPTASATSTSGGE
jgi:hypothetical protein